MADPRIKQLRIKTGIVKRVCKERVSYEKEAEKIQEKIKQMQEKGEEVYYIKKQDGLLQECLSVIPGCQRLINNGYNDLKTLVDNETELVEAEEYIAAKAVLKEFESYISK